MRDEDAGGGGIKSKRKKESPDKQTQQVG